MSQVMLHATTSRETGSASTRRLRRAGFIPAVVYGEGMAPVALSVDAKAFRAAVTGGQGLNTLLTLDADGTDYTVMAREIQRHPVRGTVAHIDFQIVDPHQVVEAEVPVHVVGDAVDVRHADWEVDQQLFSIEIRTRPDQIPSHVEVDISELQAGSTIRVADLVLPSGVTASADPSVTVVTTHPGRTTKAPGTPVVEE